MKNDIDDAFNAPAIPPRIRPTRDDILGSLRWGKQQEVPTKKGPRLRTSAPATQAMLELWSLERDELFKLGYSCSEWPQGSGKWTVSKWELLPEKIVVQRRQAHELSRATDADINAPCPEGLAYLGYQRAGIAYGFERPSVLIADEMGLGKTIQAVGLINTHPEWKKILVICPASLKLNWRRELSKWLVKKRTIFIADSQVFPEIEGIVVINYDVLHKHEDEIKGTDWDAVIVDECHLLKNKKARRSKMVLGLEATRKEKQNGAADIPGITATAKIFLTGTPIANGKAKELWPLIHYLDPITWSSWWKYAGRYCGASQDNHWNCDGSTNLEELQEKLRSTIMIRRLKKDVLKDLPPKLRKVVEIAPDATAREAINAEKAAALSEEEENQLEIAVELAKAAEDQGAYNEAVKNLALRMKSKEEDLFTLRKNTAIAKANMPAVMELLDDAVEESGKVIIFIHHKEVGRIISKRFPNSVMIVGDTPMQERQDACDRFMRDPSCNVIIGSIGAMGTGWTLTASSHVIMFELDWVPGNVSQCEDRAHRIGQRDNVLVEHYVLEGSLDCDMAKRIVDKQDLIDQALDKIKVAVDASVPAPRSGGTRTTFDSLAAEAATMTREQRIAAHTAIRLIAEACDGAGKLDHHGFNKIDAGIGRSLAAQQFLSAKQSALARKIVLKYHAQLPLALIETLKGTTT